MGELKNRGYFTTTIPNDHIRTIKKLSDDTRIAQSKLTEEAFNDLFKKHGIEIEKEPTESE